jgi:hypothetical protein
MEYTRREFEKLIVPYLDKYDFLDENTKNILKLAIANKLLSNPMSKEVQGGLEKF